VGWARSDALANVALVGEAGAEVREQLLPLLSRAAIGAGRVDDENEVAAPAVGGGDAVRREAVGAGLGVGVRGGTREDQGRPRCRRRGHGAACHLSPTCRNALLA